ncbi:unnamed protein product, partial [Didymodactylos carnosus]
MRDLSTADILIDVNKGFALRRIGKYSSEVVEEIVHTFVPLDDYCVTSPKTDVCLYTSLSTKTNVLELATMMAPRRTVHTMSAYDSNSVSRLIGKDISRVLGHYHPDQIIKETKSIVHFVDNQFHSQKNGGRTFITPSSSTAVDDQHEIPRFSQTTAAIILKQISSNKIAFEYLSYIDMKLFLAAIFATVDDSYTIFDVQESLTTFTQLVVAQTVFALRHCSSSTQESPPYQPCLAVSTLFLRLPFDGISTYSVYRLIPFPIAMSGNNYIQEEEQVLLAHGLLTALGAIFTSVLCWCSIKCYRNGGECK